MTLSELAKLAGVSVSTASKAFREAKDISKETREHIFRIARENGCYGKFAREKYEKRLIAILCPELSSAYYNHQVELLQGRLEKMGALVLVSADHFDTARQAELIEYYASYLHVDGMIVIDLRVPLKKGFDVPIIAVGGTEKGGVDLISIDLQTPIDEAVAHLKSLGHRRIAFIGDELTYTKQCYFQKSMARHLLCAPSEQIICTRERFESAGEAGMKQLLQEVEPCTAVICAYDYIALGAIRYLSRCGMQVPEDMSVIGMDNISVSGYLSRSLSTIDSHAQEMSEIVCELMEKKLKNPQFRVNQQIMITGTLVLRDSVGACREMHEKAPDA